MPTKPMIDKPEGDPRHGRWQPAREFAPSVVREEEPLWARRAGLGGLMLVVLGGVALLVSAAGRTSGLIGPNLGSLCLVVGLAALLFHASADRELQIRRSYEVFGLLWLAAAAGLFILMAARPANAGGLFGSGFLCLLGALLFLLASVRHETDATWRQAIVLGIGVLGALLALVGFIGGNVRTGDFLLPYGLLLSLAGLAYLWAFVGLVGTSDPRGYKAGLGIGLLGLVFFVLALARSFLPQLFFTWGWRARPDPYLVPTGLLLMGLGFLYVVISAALCSDNTLVVMTRRELAAYFYSPIAYIVLFAVTVIGWVMFLFFLDLVAGEGKTPLPEPIVQYYIISWWPIISVIIIVPVVTMRLLSEEKRTGTLEVLLTAPLGETTVVLSKFLAALIFFMLLWVPWGLFLVALRVWGGEPFDYLPLLSFFLGLACSGAGFLGLGLFFSSLTRNQIASAILTFVGMLTLTIVYFAKNMMRGQASGGGPWTTILRHISYVDLWMDNLTGLVSPKFLVFWASLAILSLFLTVKVLESRRWS
jgi:hypothetical protein